MYLVIKTIIVLFWAKTGLYSKPPLSITLSFHDRGGVGSFATQTYCKVTKLGKLMQVLVGCIS